MSSNLLSAPSQRVMSLLDSFKQAPAPEQPSGIPLPALYDLFLNPFTPLLFGIGYFALTKTLSYNQNGKNRIQGEGWNTLIILHNVILAVYSGWTFVQVAPSVFSAFYKAYAADGLSGLVHVFCDSDMALWNTTNFPFFCYTFYLSKFYEVIDTAIILAKGKKVGMLQSYHHTGAIWTMFSGYRTMSAPIWIFVVFNSLIHTLMYTYYTCSSMKLPFPNFLKRQLTKLQITQFLIGGSLAASYLFIQLPTFQTSFSPADTLSFGTLSTASIARMGTQCVVTEWQRYAVYLNVAYLIPLTYLFGAFFVQSYRKKGVAAAKARKEAKGIKSN